MVHVSSQNTNVRVQALVRSLRAGMDPFIEGHARERVCDVRMPDDTTYWWEHDLDEAFVTEWFRRIQAGRPTWMHRHVPGDGGKVTVLGTDPVDWAKKAVRLATLQAPAGYGADRRFGYTVRPRQDGANQQDIVIADQAFTTLDAHPRARDIVAQIRQRRRNDTANEHVFFALRLGFEGAEHLIGIHLRRDPGSGSTTPQLEGNIDPGALHLLDPNLGEYVVAADGDHEGFVRGVLQVYAAVLRRISLAAVKTWWGRPGTVAVPYRYEEEVEDVETLPAPPTFDEQRRDFFTVLDTLEIPRSKGLLPVPPKPNDDYMRFYSYTVGGLVNVVSSAGWVHVQSVPALQPTAQSLGSACKNLFGGRSDWKQENKRRAKGQYTSVAGQLINAGGAIGSRAFPHIAAFRFVRGSGLLVYAVGQGGIGQGDLYPRPKGNVVVARGWSYRMSSVMNLMGTAGHFIEGFDKLKMLGIDPTTALKAAEVLVAISNFTNAVTSFGGALGHHLKGRKEGNPWNPKVIGQLVTGVGYILSGIATTALPLPNLAGLAPWIWALGLVGMTLVYVGNYITAYGELFKKKKQKTEGTGPTDEEQAMPGGILLRTRSQVISRPGSPVGRTSPRALSTSSAGEGRSEPPLLRESDPTDEEIARMLAEAREDRRVANGLTEEQQTEEDEVVWEEAVREARQDLDNSEFEGKGKGVVRNAPV